MNSPVVRRNRLCVWFDSVPSLRFGMRLFRRCPWNVDSWVQSGNRSSIRRCQANRLADNCLFLVEKNYRINLELFEQLLWCLHDYCHDICMNSLLLSSLLSLFFCIKNHNIWRKCTANEHIIYHKMHGNGEEMHFGPKNSRAESVWSIVIFLVYSFILRIATSHEYRVIWYNQPQSRKGWIRNGLR